MLSKLCKINILPTPPAITFPPGFFFNRNTHTYAYIHVDYFFMIYH